MLPAPDPTLSGLTLHLQASVIDPNSASSKEVSIANGVILRVGND